MASRAVRAPRPRCRTVARIALPALLAAAVCAGASEATGGSGATLLLDLGPGPIPDPSQLQATWRGLPARVRSVTRPADADLPLRLGLAIDTSRSMKPWLHRVRRAASRFLEAVVAPGDEGFLVDFADRPRLAHAPTSDRDRLIARLGGLHAAGETALWDAVLFSLLRFDTPDARKALVVLTDGEDSYSRFGAERCVREARRRGVPIYLISVGEPPDIRRSPRKLALGHIARATGGRLYSLTHSDRLEKVWDEIAAELASQYLLTFVTDRALSADERRRIRIEVRDRRLSVRSVVGAGLAF